MKQEFIHKTVMKNILTGPSISKHDNPKKLMIMLHGYGDNAENFVSITRDLLIPELKINFYVPNAPSFVPQYPTGRQWFDLYPNGINFNDAGPKEKEMMKKDCESSLELIKNLQCKKEEIRKSRPDLRNASKSLSIQLSENCNL